VTDDALAEAVGHIASGLRARAAQVARAEAQLAAFAWKEDDAGTQASEGGMGLSAMLVRAVRWALDGDTYPVLRALAVDGDATVGTLAGRMGVDRLAAVDRVGAWTQAGLVGRDLETDRVGLTELGVGIVELMEQLVRAAEIEEQRP
jgi:hypothetical protein